MPKKIRLSIAEEPMTCEYVKRGHVVITKGLLRYKKKRSFVIRSQKRVRFATENRFYLFSHCQGIDELTRVSKSMSESVSEVLKNLMSVSESESEVKNSPGSESVSMSELMS